MSPFIYLWKLPEVRIFQEGSIFAMKYFFECIYLSVSTSTFLIIDITGVPY